MPRISGGAGKGQSGDWPSATCSPVTNEVFESIPLSAKSDDVYYFYPPDPVSWSWAHAGVATRPRPRPPPALGHRARNALMRAYNGNGMRARSRTAPPNRSAASSADCAKTAIPAPDPMSFKAVAVNCQNGCIENIVTELAADPVHVAAVSELNLRSNWTTAKGREFCSLLGGCYSLYVNIKPGTGVGLLIHKAVDHLLVRDSSGNVIVEKEKHGRAVAVSMRLPDSDKSAKFISARGPASEDREPGRKSLWDFFEQQQLFRTASNGETAADDVPATVLLGDLNGIYDHSAAPSTSWQYRNVLMWGAMRTLMTGPAPLIDIWQSCHPGKHESSFRPAPVKINDNRLDYGLANTAFMALGNRWESRYGVMGSYDHKALYISVHGTPLTRYGVWASDNPGKRRFVPKQLKKFSAEEMRDLSEELARRCGDLAVELTACCEEAAPDPASPLRAAGVVPPEASAADADATSMGSSSAAHLNKRSLAVDLLATVSEVIEEKRNLNGRMFYNKIWAQMKQATDPAQRDRLRSKFFHHERNRFYKLLQKGKKDGSFLKKLRLMESLPPGVQQVEDEAGNILSGRAEQEHAERVLKRFGTSTPTAEQSSPGQQLDSEQVDALLQEAGLRADCGADVAGPTLSFAVFMDLVKKAKADTAVGTDGIPLKAIAKFPEPLQVALFHIAKGWVEGHIAPHADWLEARVILLSKGGDTNPRRIEDRRPISILNALYKVVAIVLDRWLRSNLKVHPAQFGFQAGVSTWQATCRMKCIMESLGLDPGWFAFVDFRRAFPSTGVALVRAILQKRGVPSQVLKLIDSLYAGATEKINVNERVCVINEEILGLRQGCPASPVLFQIVMDVVLDLLDRRLGYGDSDRSAMNSMEAGPSQAFADDLGALVRQNKVEDFVGALRCIKTVLHLEVNVKKCGLVRLNSPVYAQDQWSYEGQHLAELKEDEMYKYLGTWVPGDLKPLSTFPTILQEMRERLKWADQWDLDLFLRAQVVNYMITPWIVHRCFGAAEVSILAKKAETLVGVFLRNAEHKPVPLYNRIIFRPLDQGGLGVRRLEPVMNTSLTHSVWKFMDSQVKPELASILCHAFDRHQCRLQLARQQPLPIMVGQSQTSDSLPAFVDLVTASLNAASSLGLALLSRGEVCAPRILCPQVPRDPAQTPAQVDTGAVVMAGWSFRKVSSQHSGSQALEAVISEMRKRISLKTAGARPGAAVCPMPAVNYEESIRHLLDTDPTTVVIYTDGSFCMKPQTAGSGFARWDLKESSADVFYARTPGKPSVLRAELYAVLGALRAAPTDRAVLLLVDNSTCQEITDNLLNLRQLPANLFDRADADIISAIHKLLPLRKRPGRALWVKSHCGLSGNLMADNAAESGASCLEALAVEADNVLESMGMTKDKCLHMQDGTLALGAVIKAQGRERWFGCVQPDGSLSTQSPEGAADVGLDCDRSHICRLKFIWGRVWWSTHLPFDPPSPEVCEKNHHYKFRESRPCQLCKESHCCEPLESLRKCSGMVAFLKSFLEIPSTLTGNNANKGIIMAGIVSQWYHARDRTVVDRRLLLRTWPQESLWKELLTGLVLSGSELRKLWNRAWNHGLPRWQTNVLNTLPSSEVLVSVRSGRAVNSAFVTGTMSEVYLFRDCELLDSIFEVNRDSTVEFASWQLKKPAPVELMPGNGSWVRIQLDPDSLRPRLSCAAQVHRRFKSGKKATLIFWDEQKKQSHGVFDCDKVSVFQDSLRADI